MAKARATLLLTPADVLMFRDSRPFDSGGEARSVSATPQTIAGAMRRWLLGHYEVSHADIGRELGSRGGRLAKDTLLEKLDEKAKWVADVCFEGPFLEKLGATYVPVPRNLVVDKDDMLRSALPLANDEKRIPQVTCGSSLPPSVPPLWLRAIEDFEFRPGWMNLTNLRSYLANPAHPLKRKEYLLPDDEFFQLEGRVRSGLDPESGRAAEKMLFTTFFLRLKRDVSLRVDVSSERFADSRALEKELREVTRKTPCLRLGGEARVAAVSLAESSTEIESIPSDGEQRITYLMTPGLFYGPYPKRVVEAGWWLCGAATGEPLPVSGWDGTRRCALPTRYAAPAGSIYFWRRREDGAVPVCHACADHRDSRAGWGRMIWGGEWKYA